MLILEAGLREGGWLSHHTPYALAPDLKLRKVYVINPTLDGDENSEMKSGTADQSESPPEFRLKA